MEENKGFFALSPNIVLDSIENSLLINGKFVRSTGVILALNSIENRVYEIELEGGKRIVAKFYRPNRWSPEQIIEEHQFTTQLVEAEIPVVAPLKLENGKSIELLSKTLGKNSENVMFSVYEKVGGRLRDELNVADVRSCAKYISQIHNIGETLGPSIRRHLDVKTYIDAPLKILSHEKWMSKDYWPHYENLAIQLKNIAEQKLPYIKKIRIHGDCHVGNVIWNWNDEPLFVDFDDSMTGPAVQDLWMMIRGRELEDEKLKEQYLEAYSYFREFDQNELKIIEVLRGMRLIYYSSWIAQRWEDPSFPHYFPNFASPSYWQEEIQALREILELIEN